MSRSARIDGQQRHLRCSSDVAPGKTDIGCPGNVAHPISVTLQYLFFDPRLRVFSVAPDLDEVVAPCTGEPLDGLDGWLARRGVYRLRCDQRPGLDGGGPRDGIAANGMSNEHVSAPLSVVCAFPLDRQFNSSMRNDTKRTLECEDGDLPVRRRAG